MDQDRDAAWAARMDQWWADWWAADYSWEGLAEKPWHGWVRPEDDGPCIPAMDGVAGRPATLQDYFRDRLGSDVTLIPAPDETRHFTRLHLPLKWPDGTSTEKADWPGDALDDDLRVLFSAAERSRPEDEQAFRPPDRRAQCDGAVFLKVNLSSILQDDRVSLSLSCKNAAFSGDASFGMAAFYDHANFGNAAFSGDANFGMAAFYDHASFGNAAFSGDATFTNAAFSGDADFGMAAFSDRADFYYTAFSGFAAFHKAAFSGFSIFDHAAFSDVVLFDRASFSAHASFHNAAFGGYAGFDNTAFSSYAGFYDTAFSGNASFHDAAFSGDANFGMAHFEGDAWFGGAGLPTTEPEVRRALTLMPKDGDAPGALHGTVIAPPVLLPLASRSFQSITVEDAVFIGDADFRNRDILRPSTFAGARFLGLARFQGSRLHQAFKLFDTRFDLVLDYVKLGTFAERVGTWRRGSLDPRTGTRGADVTVGRWPGASLRLLEAKRRFANEPPLADLDDRAWNRAVRDWTNLVQRKRTEASLGTRLDPLREKLEADKKLPLEALDDNAWKTAVSDWIAGEQETGAKALAENSRYDDIESAFRTLKLAMEDTRARLSESNFFKLELKARRRRRDRDLWEQVFSDLYGAMSDYGASAYRPLIWLAGSLVVFALVYWIGDSDFTPGSLSAPDWRNLDWRALRLDPDFLNALRYSGSRMLPFGALDEEKWPWREALLSDTLRGGLMRTLATGQSVLAAILSFQFALAIRRRFQIT